LEVQPHTFLTLALAGGKWPALCPSYFIPWERNSVPTGEGTGWAPVLVWTWWQREKVLDLLEIKPQLSDM